MVLKNWQHMIKQSTKWQWDGLDPSAPMMRRIDFFFKYIKKSHCIYNFYIKKQQKNKKNKKTKTKQNGKNDLSDEAFYFSF